MYWRYNFVISNINLLKPRECRIMSTAQRLYKAVLSVDRDEFSVAQACEAYSVKPSALIHSIADYMGDE